MPVFSVLGAQCTLLDYSSAQLESDRRIAAEEGYAIELVQADMTKPLPFADESFDLIFHPVSNCYIAEVLPLWRECCRVLRKSGVILSGLDNGINFLFDDDGVQDPPIVSNPLPFNPLEMPQEEFERMAKNNEAIQFSHSLEEQLGGQLAAGLILTDLYEDRDSDGILQKYVPQYIATRAVKGTII